MLMNEFILNDMQIAKTNGSTAHEILPSGMLTEQQLSAHILYFSASLKTAFYTNMTNVDVLLFTY